MMERKWFVLVEGIPDCSPVNGEADGMTEEAGHEEAGHEDI
jgi:hypothetical protein